ncbi:hypothetical protein QCA50_012536 [Cerrena zonata]|uniref:Uncharacterized protein n=1 Tax=Cerrena zonata TaxID=2478898 RepID=A0AAW0FY26_9APHY
MRWEMIMVVGCERNVPRHLSRPRIEYTHLVGQLTDGSPRTSLTFGEVLSSPSPCEGSFSWDRCGPFYSNRMLSLGRSGM